MVRFLKDIFIISENNWNLAINKLRKSLNKVYRKFQKQNNDQQIKIEYGKIARKSFEIDHFIQFADEIDRLSIYTDITWLDSEVEQIQEELQNTLNETYEKFIV